MAETAPMLVELGCEELPPTALKRLSEAFAAELVAGIEQAGLAHGEVTTYATPRRLAVLVEELEASQDEREIERRGPSLKVAYDADGAPTKAAAGFARSVGVPVEHLEQLSNDQGAWLVFRTTDVGEMTTSLLPALVETALGRLPIPKPMRWADLDVEFVRPVHWLVLVYGDDVVPASVLGVESGRYTHGHRFHAPSPLVVDDPTSYAMLLYGSGHVVASFDARRDMIRRQVEDAAETLGGRAVIDEALLDETAALVEWPTAVSGSFDEKFLALPAPVLIATMKGNQRYFHLVDSNDALLPHFITISNIESRSPEVVQAGNERVIRPRLADAAFFYESDLASGIEQWQQRLEGIIFQHKLGSIAAKAARVSRLAGHVAVAMGCNPDTVKKARRAGLLGKFDLVTEVVLEFPELQGQMGRVYASAKGEPDDVAIAIEEAYMPRFAGDAIAASTVGRTVAIADKLDTLAGIFGIGQLPSGDRDPFALRRAALGVLRTIIEGELPLNLGKLTNAAVAGYDGVFEAGEVASQVNEFMWERLRGYFHDQGVPADVFAAVHARQTGRPHDFALRVHAVDAFRQLPEAASLAAANKRIQNILRQAEDDVPAQVDDTLFREDAEWNLAAMLVGLGPHVRDLLKKADYTGALTSLAGLRNAVDAFFDTVKVMDDNAAVRANRLALLNNIGSLFLETADISRLQG